MKFKMSASINFSAPKENLIFQKLNHFEDNNEYQSIVSKQQFNHAVSLVCPGLIKPSLEWIKDIVNVQTWKVKNIPSWRLVEEEFVEGFVKNGHVQILSDKTYIDQNNCLCVLNSGELILHVNKDMYHSLGLEGKPSRYCTRHKPTKYVIEIDMAADSFIPGKKYYERVLNCLQHQHNLKFDLLIYWEPPDEDICPSSIEAYFKKKGYEVIKMEPEVIYRPLHNISHPDFDSPEFNLGDNYQEVFEWLGCVACNINLENSNSESYLSTLSCPVPNITLNTSCYYQLTGFFSPNDIQQLLCRIRSSLSKMSECPWINVTVHGFSDSPVSNGKNEHGFHQGGDNLYSVVLFPDKKQWLYRATDVYDIT